MHHTQKDENCYRTNGGAKHTGCAPERDSDTGAETHTAWDPDQVFGLLNSAPVERTPSGGPALGLQTCVDHRAVGPLLGTGPRPMSDIGGAEFGGGVRGTPDGALSGHIVKWLWNSSGAPTRAHYTGVHTRAQMCDLIDDWATP